MKLWPYHYVPMNIFFMNKKAIIEAIQFYKARFKKIHKEEIYKWRAVKCFQDNWDIDASDFAAMLKKSLGQAKNLLDSRNYLPKINLLRIAEREPENVKHLFQILYNEQMDLLERVSYFLSNIKVLYSSHIEEKKDFQDHRSVMVYLTLRYPERYYLYKYKMFRTFAYFIGYPYKPTKGNNDNLVQYMTMCSIFKDEVVKDEELLKLHTDRLTDGDYFDRSFNILSQDIIYSIDRRKGELTGINWGTPASERLKENTKKILPQKRNAILKGSFTNFIENERENKRIGDLGELLVLEYEQERLKAISIVKEPKHISKTEGDGYGFDILSYNDKGEEIYIEVKTTTYGSNTPFFITANELKKSIKDSNKYFLYRLYEYNDETDTAKYFIRHGCLEELCCNPVLYKVYTV
jgi:hypothetical protein